jgi:hypothetical protein
MRRITIAVDIDASVNAGKFTQTFALQADCELPVNLG